MSIFKNLRAIVFFLLLALSMLCLSRSQGQPASQTPQAEKQADEKIPQAHRELGDESFEKPRSGSKRHWLVGRPALPLLKSPPRRLTPNSTRERLTARSGRPRSRRFVWAELSVRSPQQRRQTMAFAR